MGPKWLPRYLGFPVKGLFLDLVNETDQEEGQENHHGAKDQVSMLNEHVFVDHRPWLEKNHFDIKQDEQHRH